MKKNKIKNNKVLLPVGSSSLIMVFIVLCLAIFSAITFLTAANEKKLTNQSAEFLKKYYLANEQASIVLNNIQKTLDNIYADGNSDNLSNEDLNMIVSAVDSYQLSIVDNNQIEFDVPVTDSLIIKAKAGINNDKKLEIISYSLFNKNSMNVIEDEFLNLFEGDEGIEGFADNFKDGD